MLIAVIFFIKITFSLSDFLFGTPKSSFLFYVVNGVTPNSYIFKLDIRLISGRADRFS